MWQCFKHRLQLRLYVHVWWSAYINKGFDYSWARHLTSSVRTNSKIHKTYRHCSELCNPQARWKRHPEDLGSNSSCMMLELHVALGDLHMSFHLLVWKLKLRSDMWTMGGSWRSSQLQPLSEEMQALRYVFCDSKAASADKVGFTCIEWLMCLSKP